MTMIKEIKTVKKINSQKTVGGPIYI